MNNRGLRTFVAIATGLAVIYFGSGGGNAGEGRRVTTALLVLAGFAALVAWLLTKPGSSASR